MNAREVKELILYHLKAYDAKNNIRETRREMLRERYRQSDIKANMHFNCLTHQWEEVVIFKDN